MAKKIFYKPADAAVAYTEVEIAELEKKLIAVYSEAEADIQKKMDDFTAKYQKQDLIYQKQLKEGLITQADYDDWKKGRVFVGKQWAAKKDEIAAVLHNSNKISTSMINMSAFDVFGENSNYMAYTMEHTAGVNFGFQVYNTDAVAQLIKDDPELLPKWKVDQKKDYDWNRKNLNNAITQGIIQGESLSKISKRVSSSLAGKNENLMNTFAKTGMTQAQNSGRLERMEKGKALGIDVKKKWVATLDGRTRYAHRELDGQIVDTDEDFKTEGYTIAYPGDPQAHPSLVYNCRCAITSSFDKYPSKYQRYDNIDGVPIDGMTYREWEEAKGRTVKSKPSTDFISLDNDDNFGKPGIYDVYRAGDIFESPLGFLSFGMDEKQSLDYVALHNNAAIKEYAIDVRNPLYVKGTSFDDIQDELARKYTGKSILDDDLSLDEIRLIMNNACEEIEKEGYDSIVQVVENRITGTKKYEVGVLNGHLDTIKLKSDYLDDINGVKSAKKVIKDAKKVTNEKVTAEKLFNGTGLDVEKAREAIVDWGDGVAYDIRLAQQSGYASKESVYIEKLIKEANQHYTTEDGSIYRGIMADKSTSKTFDNMIKALEEEDYEFFEDYEFMDMMGTSSWTADSKIANDFAKNADKIGGLELDGDTTPCVFELTGLEKDNDVALYVDDIINLEQREVILSKDAKLSLEDIRKDKDGYHISLRYNGR